ncbi:type II toxin-antitoxin system HicA family toxin [Butyrivibrio sp. INlla14]|uniref:type II toxin-antitoxin system HicA family toxin n=1 Tax=Butyrivibrio sp. INlla14 TaxID=1520808 RepID=UPI000875F12B|nr:type II toxin-antitoxin system HicA family toxin [Butyrivibrio sp. INlla14]SCY69585.1 Predicted RNA binding protein YcfA, dsRBD-like fold, HicA-like mRNA interferase family [Butyrivibrio sp. INlla14]SCY77918.1 Predicted RNA binding protein YcfA, dsRBD-like fold, HicA-like mRNA interferase family [Butyrivibrio sp. INlla14]
MATVSEIVRKIKRKTNCYILRHGAEHDIWINPDNGIEFTIPRHPSRELASGTAKSILRAAGLL